MALTDTKIPYEILIRFGADGQPRGGHCQYLRRVVLDGEVLKEEVGQAEPLDLEDFPTSAVMTETTRSALVQITELTARLEAAADRLETADERAKLLAAENESLIKEAEALRAEVDAHALKVASLTDELAAKPVHTDVAKPSA